MGLCSKGVFGAFETFTSHFLCFKALFVCIDYLMYILWIVDTHAYLIYLTKVFSLNAIAILLNTKAETMYARIISTKLKLIY